jgi:molybdenum cofactor guanylyltransferase
LENEEKINGIILAGGKSSRMGRDKGLIDIGGKRLIDRALELISPFCEEIIISTASEKYADLGFQCIPDEITGTGPIGGIYSALKASSRDANFVLSFDMPFIPGKLIEYILMKKGDGQIAVPLESSGFYQPLCGFYHRSVVPVIEEMMRNEDYKLIDLFGKVEFKPINISTSLEFYSTHIFLNINRQEDIDLAQSLMN